MKEVDMGGFPFPEKGHNNPPRKKAKKAASEFPYDVGTDITKMQGNDHGTGSLQGQPLAQKKKTILPNPSF